MRRTRSSRRSVTVVVVAAAAIFVVAGGPATAGRLITKNQIAPSAITNKAIANGAVTDAKLAPSVREKLTGKAGAPGAAGARGDAGAKGDTGARGPAGAFNVIDATGKVLGIQVPPINPAYTAFMTAEGAILQYDPNTNGPAFPSDVSSGPIYYQSAGCAGTGYVEWPSSEAFQKAIVLPATPVAGSDIYVMTPATPQAFTAASRLGGGGCASTSTPVINAFPVKAAGKVPAVTKPLLLQPAS